MKRYGLTVDYEVLASVYKDLVIGRIIGQERGLYRLVIEYGEKMAEVSGKFRYEVITVSDYPAIGDFVMVDWNENQGNAIIRNVLHRKSTFLRKAAGNAHEEQVIAANIDTVFVCMALNNDFNVRRLERYMTLVYDSGATPVIVLTKGDLCENIDEKLLELTPELTLGTEIIVTKAFEENGYESLMPFLKSGKTVAFVGSSGVGKTTLINRLLGEERFETNGLRNDDKGRHTTTRRELVLLDSGVMVIDTPGMRELGMWDSEVGIEQVFAEIEEIACNCRFHNCTHTNEPGCAICDAIENGELSEERFRAYQKLKAENAYANDSTSYLEAKNKKFKEIAKYNKTNRNKY